jgi:hypothetical protein
MYPNLNKFFASTSSRTGVLYVCTFLGVKPMGKIHVFKNTASISKLVSQLCVDTDRVSWCISIDRYIYKVCTIILKQMIDRCHLGIYSFSSAKCTRSMQLIARRIQTKHCNGRHGELLEHMHGPRMTIWLQGVPPNPEALWSLRNGHSTGTL